MSKTNLSKLKLGWMLSPRSGVNSRDRDVLEGLQPHPNIKELEIENYPGAEFPSWMQMGDPLSSFPKLVKLRLRYLKNVEEWSLDWNENDNLPALQYLELFCCDQLKSLPAQLCNLTSLKSLSITFCDSLSSLPRELSRLTLLETLHIGWCPCLESLPELGMQEQKSCIRSLVIDDCKELSSRLEGLQYLTSLESLELKKCPKLKLSTHDLEHLSALKTLKVDSPIDLPEFMEGRVSVTVISNDSPGRWVIRNED
ncbi:hypothetical protein Sjap_005203 [Stephania japonica]|uniref:R13L1/DRL21-like LRR repeat region domain-containing protein n=1 Tax=Stephania japonica TaxID=461633 RepID=A0AAP0PKX5_9MAGN